METIHVIRHKHFTEGLSVRRIARELGLNRRTVRKYLEVSAPARIETVGRLQPVLSVVRPRIEALLEEWAPRLGGKHRLTSTRLHRQLREEGLKVGERTLRAYLAEKRRQEAEVFIPLVHRAGDEGQVDFFDVTVEVGGILRKAWKFLLRLMYSGRDFVWLYDRCDQIAFLDGHVRALAYLGGVPGRLVYDNLTAAVKRLVGLRERKLTDRFRALSSHYLFEPCFARPGEGHDKGGVEGRGKVIRLQHMTPIRAGKDLAEISAAALADVDRLWQARTHVDGRLLSAMFAEERPLLRRLPATPFEPRHLEPVAVDKSSTVKLERAVYSLPERWARLDAEAWIGVDDVRFSCRGETQLRLRQKPGSKIIHYRDYLRQLSRKPQAVRQVAPELLAELGEPYRQLWTLLEKTHGPQKAARVLAGVLGALDDHGAACITPALREALQNGAFDADGGHLLNIRNYLPSRPVLQAALVPQALRGVEIQAGSAADYDFLLAAGGVL